MDQGIRLGLDLGTPEIDPYPADRVSAVLLH